MGGDEAQREQRSINRPWRGNVSFLERVYKVEAFKKLLLAKFEEFNKTIFVPQRFLKQVDEFGAALRPAVKEKEESAAMLERFDKVVAGEAITPNRFGGRGGFGMAVKPIKGFVTARAASVIAQTQGKSEGISLNGGDRRGPGGGGPGNMLAPAFMSAMDANKDGELSREEFAAGFDRWFTAWNTDKSGVLTEEQLRAGLNREFTPQRNNRGFFGLFGGGGDPPPPAPGPGAGPNDGPPNAGPGDRQPNDSGRRGRGGRGNQGRFGQ
jgi:hypothetical protein